MVERFANFYDTVAFSQWSYHFHFSKMMSKKVWASYKHALKDYIRKTTGDDTYYSAKLKMQYQTIGDLSMLLTQTTTSSGQRSVFI